jgi:ribosomal protein S18 acetylase RimI-like enzyme
MSVRAAETSGKSDASRVTVGSLDQSDLAEAARIFRLAFGTFFGVADPETFWTDRDYAFGRHAAPHVAAFGAKLDGELIGSNFATRWGSHGFVGPLSVRPDLQDRGIAQLLLRKTMAQFEAWGTRHVGLFTFPQSARHVGLYQKFGFSARFLTAVMSAPARAQRVEGSLRLSTLPKAEQDEALSACRRLANALYPGLDLAAEIRTTQTLGLGDTVLIESQDGIAAFAICQHGPQSEAGADMCYVKFGAAHPGPSAEPDFVRLVEACESYAATIGTAKVLAGVNMGRHEAYRLFVARGYRTATQGVAMHKDNEPGYSRPGLFIIDDWR